MATQTRIHLKPLQAIDLPSHKNIPSDQAGGTLPNLQTFLTEVLAEGDGFLTTTLHDQNVFKLGDVKHQSPATASIQIRSAVIPHQPTENWYARTSIHEDASKDGTATWAEFDGHLRANHSNYEKEYTPSVVSAHKEYSWEQDLQAFGATAGNWQDITMEIRLMRHKMPVFFLKDREFRVLVVTARAQDQDKFIVVQIPVARNAIPETVSQAGQQAVDAIYCSVELGELHDGQITWSMGTASDAKGVLPMAVQKTQMANAVAIDVSYFIKWRMEKRNS
ncbi:hypothetical protein CB0940_01253 [Cercospora beticola]|uniref:DUF3074 domain-containing protein n=1 Tax=Cercospora beticola TaxID=122368 RepID=A0A2G5I9P5_CERBT|nr:hypothetical protein CB0940_01253 [Cercospora beticola]PIB01515.1 hypothetical protein CB0940_01253 [Cercospora beticola]WPA96685.1 hypothetical protein RHO25_001293 [Cercospora beticola]